MRAMPFLMLLLACGTDPRVTDPHEIVECQSEWRPGVTVCAAACAVMPSTPTAEPCAIVAGTCAADSVVNVDGHRGCCTVGSEGGELRILFESCE